MSWVRKLVAGILFTFAGFAMAATVITEYDDVSASLPAHALPGLNKQGTDVTADQAEPVPLVVWLLGLSLVAVAGVARHRSRK